MGCVLIKLTKFKNFGSSKNFVFVTFLKSLIDFIKAKGKNNNAKVIITSPNKQQAQYRM